jgi:hypothetical protein
MHHYHIPYQLLPYARTGALQDSSAAPSSACVAVDDGGSSPLPLLAVLADGFGAPKSCPSSATCTWLMRAILAFGIAAPASDAALFRFRPRHFMLSTISY